MLTAKGSLPVFLIARDLLGFRFLHLPFWKEISWLFCRSS
jgi:hypothetical protein